MSLWYFVLLFVQVESSQLCASLCEVRQLHICFSIFIVIISFLSLFLNAIDPSSMYIVPSLSMCSLFSVSPMLHNWHATLPSILHFSACFTVVVQPNFFLANFPCAMTLSIDSGIFQVGYFVVSMDAIASIFSSSLCMETSLLHFCRLLIVFLWFAVCIKIKVTLFVSYKTP